MAEESRISPWNQTPSVEYRVRLSFDAARPIMGQMDSQTVSTFLAATLARRAEAPALGFVRGGELQWRTWNEVADEAAALAAVIRAAGIARGDCVAHVSENRYEWIITDLAIHLAQAVHVPIHVTLAGEQIAEQIRDCGARLVFVSTRELLAKFAEQVEGSIVVLVHDEQAEGRQEALLGKPAVPPDTGLGKFATASSEQPAVAPIPAPSPPTPAPDDLATILYTSGTTGRPRGVMLSHRNLASNAASAAEAHGGTVEQISLCVLPLSHIYARTCDLYTWVYRGSRLVLAECRETLARDCQLVKPTALNAVPFLYQRIAERIATSGANDESATLRHFFGGRMEKLFSGGAPLAPSVETWYAERGLAILQGYGLTEASPVISVSTLSATRFGSVGRPLPDVEVRIADDGEVLCHGPNVMLGYWRDESATAEVIRDGWLYTGDLGEMDDDNFLFIRGRKKELIVLSTGKKVSPTRVENLLTASPLIEQAAVFGDGRCGLTALIVPAAWSKEHGARSEEQGAGNEVIAAEIERCLQPAAHEEQIHSFRILDRPFSIELGEMTPKLSLCREVIRQNFAAELNAM